MYIPKNQVWCEQVATKPCVRNYEGLGPAADEESEGWDIRLPERQASLLPDVLQAGANQIDIYLLAAEVGRGSGMRENRRILLC